MIRDRRPHRWPPRVAVRAAVLAASLAVTACAPGADRPEAVVRAAIEVAGSGDLEGLRALACAGQEDLVRAQLGLDDALGSELLPEVPVERILEAVELDLSSVLAGDAVIEGEVARVPVTGVVELVLDRSALAPIVREVVAAEGRELGDAEIDALLDLAESSGSSIPVDAEVRLVREAGAWRICQEELPAP